MSASAFARSSALVSASISSSADALLSRYGHRSLWNRMRSRILSTPSIWLGASAALSRKMAFHVLESSHPLADSSSRSAGGVLKSPERIAREIPVSSSLTFPPMSVRDKHMNSSNGWEMEAKSKSRTAVIFLASLLYSMLLVAAKD